jgi:predicted dehydrogenase
MKYNTAIIGLGNAGWKLDTDKLRTDIWTHAKAYTEHPSTQLVAVYDWLYTEKNFTPFHKLYPNTKIAPSLDFVFKDKIDIVSVCTPINTHFDVLKELLNYPIKAVFCEKPFTANTYEAKIITQLYKEKGIILAVNYMRRWDNRYQYIANTIANKKLGELKSIIAHTSTALYTSASHMIDLIIWYGGIPTAIIGTIDKKYIREVNGKKDYGGRFYFYNNNTNVNGFLYAECDDKTKHQFNIQLDFTNGRIISTTTGEIIVISKYKKSSNFTGYKELKYEEHIEPKGERILNAVSNIIKVINNPQEKLLCTAENAINVHRFIDQCLLKEVKVC